VREYRFPAYPWLLYRQTSWSFREVGEPIVPVWLE
jgi:hypothetical protein